MENEINYLQQVRTLYPELEITAARVIGHGQFNDILLCSSTERLTILTDSIVSLSVVLPGRLMLHEPSDAKLASTSSSLSSL